MSARSPHISLALALLTLAAPAGVVWGDPSFERQYGDLTEALEAQGGAAQLYVRRAKLALSHGDAASALEDLDRAEAADPALLDVPLRRGEAYRLLMRWEDALAAYDACLATAPSHVAALMGRAQALEGLKRWGDAAQSWAEAVAGAQVPTPDPYLAWARALAQSGPEGIQPALDVLEEAQRGLGPLPGLETVAVTLELERGATDAALARLDGLIAGAQRPETYLAQRAQILEDAGRLENARVDYARALAAVVTLPETARGATRTRALEADLRAALRRLSADPPSSPSPLETDP